VRERVVEHAVADARFAKLRGQDVVARMASRYGFANFGKSNSRIPRSHKYNSMACA
jgi:hypothetical protein